MNTEWTLNPPDSKRRSAGENQRSQTIPMPRSHVARTNSEVQLHEDMAAAEWRDLCMFYRVVNGIRERQVSSSCTVVAENDGVRIDASTRERTINNGSHQQISHAWETVTPYQSSNEASPHTHRYREQAEGYLSQHVTPNVTPFADSNDGWSISGYEEVEPSLSSRPVPVVEEDEDNVDDDGVFSMEL